MELIYIWIENFRNIQKQGFNFSSIGKFDYSDENKELTYLKNPIHMPDFFHPNISNITAIVGRNGTGKSNLLELINYILRSANTANLSSFFFILKEESVFKVFQYNNSKKIINKCDFLIEFIDYSGVNKSFTNIYFSNVFDNRNNLFSEDVIDLSLNKFGRNKFGENIHTYQQEEIRNQIKFVNSKYFKNIKNEDLKVPKSIVLSSPLWLNLKNKAQAVEKRNGVIGLVNFYKIYRPRLMDARSDKSFHYYSSFLIFMNTFFTPLGEGFDEGSQSVKGNYHLNNSQVNNLNFILKEIQDGGFDIRELHQFIITTFGDFLTKNFQHSKALVDFLRYELNDSSINEFFLEKSSKGRYSKGRLEFKLDFENKTCKSFLNSYFKAIGNVTLYNFDWDGISSGEKAFLSLFSRFYSILRRVRQKNILICIDEGDLYFHPKWQLEFLNYMINYLPEIFIDRTIQIILSTHSPFLVSDLPKSNLIFLDSNANGSCKVIKEDDIDIETFGGNVHMLYAKTFFLANGTIGGFAFNKLKEVIKTLKGEGSSLSLMDAKNISKLVGDPIIKNQLIKMIND